MVIITGLGSSDEYDGAANPTKLKEVAEIAKILEKSCARVSVVEDINLFVEMKFDNNDIIIFLTKKDLIAAMLIQDDCPDVGIILVSSSLDGKEDNEIRCDNVVFVKREGSYLQEILRMCERRILSGYFK